MVRVSLLLAALAACGKAPVTTPSMSARKHPFDTPTVATTTGRRLPATPAKGPELVVFVWTRHMVSSARPVPFQAYRDGTVVFEDAKSAVREGRLPPERVTQLAQSVADRIREPDLRMFYNWTDQTQTYIFVRDGAEWLVAQAPSAKPLFYDEWTDAERSEGYGILGTAPRFDEATIALTAAARRSTSQSGHRIDVSDRDIAIRDALQALFASHR